MREYNLLDRIERDPHDAYALLLKKAIDELDGRPNVYSTYVHGPHKCIMRTASENVQKFIAKLEPEELDALAEALTTAAYNADEHEFVYRYGKEKRQAVIVVASAITNKKTVMFFLTPVR